MSLLAIGWLLSLAAALHAVVGISSAVYGFHTARKPARIGLRTAVAFALAMLSFLSAVIVAMMASNVFNVIALVGPNL